MEKLVLNEEQLVAWGRELGAGIHAPRTILLSGDLGAGKTVLVRAICEGYGVAESVTSPTFALIHRYQSERSPVFHIDLYRLNTERECADLGIEELMSDHALVLIEWPERGNGLFPVGALRIRIDHVPEDRQLRALSG